MVDRHTDRQTGQSDERTCLVWLTRKCRMAFSIGQPSNHAPRPGFHQPVPISASMSLQSPVPTAWASNPSKTHRNCHTDLHLQRTSSSSFPARQSELSDPHRLCSPAEPDLRIGFRL